MNFNEEFFKKTREQDRRMDEESAHLKEKARFNKEFEKINRRELAGWPDETLAAWPAKFPPESRNLFWRNAAWIGLTGVIVGALLSRILEKLQATLTE